MCEPLKNKKLEMSYRHEQVVSAVKWLKKELEENWEAKIVNEKIIGKTMLYNIINDAFEDAIRGGKE